MCYNSHWCLVTCYNYSWCVATCYNISWCLAMCFNSQTIVSGHLLKYGVWPLVTIWSLAMCLLPTLMSAIIRARPLSTLTQESSLGIQSMFRTFTIYSRHVRKVIQIIIKNLCFYADLEKNEFHELRGVKFF